jgi:eukaryotic-like serine/threonine-protein kinase
MEEGATQSADRRASALLGRVIAGKFRIESYVGSGAMGAVYRARQLALDKDVAVKILHGEHAGDATYVARFQREARAASRLDHPNSMRVLDFGQEPDGLLYIAMELLVGRDLFHVIREDWPLPAARVADVMSQMLAALALAHDMGIVHRDLKPENIMMLVGTDDEGRERDVVKVCDFGIAKFTGSREAPGGTGEKLTLQGIVVGTPEYMSPEQGKGEALDARSDLYAAGVILYQLLTGRVPFEAENAVGIVLKHVTEEAVPPREIAPAVDPRLEAVCAKAMRKKREDRYQSAREMRQDLRAILGGRSRPPPDARGVPAGPASTRSAPGTVPVASAPVAVVAAASKLTPAGTVTEVGRPSRPSRGRGALLAVAALAALAGAVATWRASLVPTSHERPAAAPSVPASVLPATVFPAPSAAPAVHPEAGATGVQAPE